MGHLRLGMRWIREVVKQDVVETCILMIDGLFSYNKVEDACFPVEDIVKFPYQKFDSFLMQLSVIDNS